MVKKTCEQYEQNNTTIDRDGLLRGLPSFTYAQNLKRDSKRKSNQLKNRWDNELNGRHVTRSCLRRVDC